KAILFQCARRRLIEKPMNHTIMRLHRLSGEGIRFTFSLQNLPHGGRFGSAAYEKDNGPCCVDKRKSETNAPGIEVFDIYFVDPSVFRRQRSGVREKRCRMGVGTKSQ